MNWIDEKVKEYRTWLASSINNGLLVPRTAEEVDHWLRTALTEAKAQGAQEALAKVEETVEQNHARELAELEASNNRSDTKDHIRKGFEVYKTALLHYLQQLKDNKEQ